MKQCMRVLMVVALAGFLTGCVTKRTISTNGHVTEERTIVKGPLTNTVYLE